MQPGDDPFVTIGEVGFDNALFPLNANDQRWVSFDYAFDASELSQIIEDSTGIAGLYELELAAVDHKRTGVNEIEAYSEISTDSLADDQLSTVLEENPADFLSKLVGGMMNGMKRIFAQKDITKVGNESEFLTTDPAAIDEESFYPGEEVIPLSDDDLKAKHRAERLDIVSVLAGSALSDQFRIGDAESSFYTRDAS